MPSCKIRRVGSQAIEQQVEMRLRSQLERWHQILCHWQQKKKPLSNFELEWENHVAQPDDTSVDEVHIYLNLTPSKEYDDRDLLGWCSQHEKTIPFLSRLAGHVLRIPAGSSSSERVFSTAGRTLEERRASLKPSTVDAILFLFTTHANKQWMMTTVHAYSSVDLFIFYYYLMLASWWKVLWNIVIQLLHIKER